MGLGKIRKLKSIIKGGILRKVGKLIGKASGRLHTVRTLLFKLKSAQINRIVGSSQLVASQVEVLGGNVARYASPIGAVAGGVSKVAGTAADIQAQVNGFVSSIDEYFFRLGRQLYKRCYRILKLCSKVLGTISKFSSRIFRIIRIVKAILKIGKWVAKLLGATVFSKLIAKAEIFLQKIENALLIISRSTGQLAAICRDLFDQLSQVDEKYDIRPEDLSGFDREFRIECIPDRLYPDDEFCDPDWDDELDNDSVIQSELQELDSELDDLEFEIEEILNRRAPQTKNECLRFLADLDCVDKLEGIINGLNNISTSDGDAQSIINRAKGNINTAKVNIESSVGILDFENVGFPPYDASNDRITEASSETNAPAAAIVNVKELNIDRAGIEVDGDVEYNDKFIPEYLNHRQHIKNEEIDKLTGPEKVSRYKTGVTLRKAMDFVTPEELLKVEPTLFNIDTARDVKFYLE